MQSYPYNSRDLAHYHTWPTATYIVLVSMHRLYMNYAYPHHLYRSHSSPFRMLFCIASWSLRFFHSFMEKVHNDGFSIIVNTCGFKQYQMYVCDVNFTKFIFNRCIIWVAHNMYTPLIFAIQQQKMMALEPKYWVQWSQCDCLILQQTNASEALNKDFNGILAPLILRFFF